MAMIKKNLSQHAKSKSNIINLNWKSEAFIFSTELFIAYNFEIFWNIFYVRCLFSK